MFSGTRPSPCFMWKPAWSMTTTCRDPGSASEIWRRNTAWMSWLMAGVKSNSTECKAVFKPSKDFHTARHTLFTPEQNLEIDKVVPVSASVKTKLGRGGGEE
jgi:hypothetical protein